MADSPAVLIVEDEQNLQSIFADYLQEEYRVLTASTFDEAVGCPSDDIDVVLLDRTLSKKSGDSLLPHINGRGTKVAMVTAVEPDFDIVDVDIDDYLTKPVSREELRDTADALRTMASYDSKVVE